MFLVALVTVQTTLDNLKRNTHSDYIIPKQEARSVQKLPWFSNVVFLLIAMTSLTSDAWEISTTRLHLNSSCHSCQTELCGDILWKWNKQQTSAGDNSQKINVSSASMNANQIDCIRKDTEVWRIAGAGGRCRCRGGWIMRRVLVQYHYMMS